MSCAVAQIERESNAYDDYLLLINRIVVAIALLLIADNVYLFLSNPRAGLLPLLLALKSDVIAIHQPLSLSDMPWHTAAAMAMGCRLQFEEPNNDNNKKFVTFVIEKCTEAYRKCKIQKIYIFFCFFFFKC